jgi:hypothetical protein
MVSASAQGALSSETKPRITIMSVRNTEDHVSRACGYEFEDMICEELDFARIVSPGPFRGRRHAWAHRLQARATAKFGPKPVLGVLSTPSRKVRLNADCDLFFFSAAQPRDLVELGNVPDWRDRSRFAVCWLQEMWIRDITPENRLLDILEQFDYVICSFHHSIEPLSRRISTPVGYMPWGIDTIKFCPYPNPPRRVIEVAGIGVVPEATEQALIRHADETGSFFHYQTVFGPSVVKSHRAHRHNFASLLKRSEFFLCYMAKFANSERDQQIEFGLRYIEGAAAGTILLGDPVDNPAFEDYLGWADSVIPLDAAETAPEAVIEALRDQPGRIATARRQNMVNALMKLDNLYRWRDILKLADLPETRAMGQRQKRLNTLIEMIQNDDGLDAEGFAMDHAPVSAQ